MNDLVAWLKDRLLRFYDRNPFVVTLGIKVTEINKGQVSMAMPVIREVHGNLHGAAHGGALASLADTAMGMCCATFGNRVVTLEMNINFIRSAQAGDTVMCRAQAVHAGKSTMVVEAELLDSAGVLLAKTRGTFYVIGRFSDEDN